MVAALSRSDHGDFAGARALLDRALALEPDNPAILTGLGVHLFQAGQLRDAVLACDAAIRLWPDYPDAWRQRGAILAAGGSSQAARESFREALRLNPDDAGALASLAALASREGDHPAAREAATRALALDGGNVVAASALASALLADGDASAALALLGPVVAGLDRPSHDRSLAWSIVGNAHHARGDRAEAYAAFARAKADFAVLHERDTAGRLTHADFIAAIDAGVRRAPVSAWAAAPPTATVPDAPPTHVFLLGYPRSGTTLMENILASLPGVAALEERPTLSAADQRYLAGSAEDIGQGIAALAAAAEPELDALRRAYWAKVRDSGVSAHVRAFVDMDPLKGTRLPLIARLFPRARVLLMRRDPRDVVWSCFRTNFAPSSGAYDFTTLDRAARHYDRLMRLTDLCRETMPLEIHEVHYHALVQDFDATVRAALAFAGLPWDPAVREFDRTARRRGVSTASVGQVSRGLYDGTRQWEPYAAYLEPVMPLLEPWIRRFGYA